MYRRNNVDNNYNRDKDWRVAMEGDVKDLSTEVAGIKSEVASIGKSMEHLIIAFDRSSARDLDSQKTPWANYIAAGVLVVLMVGMVGSGYVRDLERIEQDQKLTSIWQIEHTLRVGPLNAAQWERIRAVERYIWGNGNTVEFGKAVGSGG